MNERIRNPADLDRLIPEPGRLAIVSLLSAVEEADFLQALPCCAEGKLLTNTGWGFNRGTDQLQSLFRVGRVSAGRAGELRGGVVSAGFSSEGFSSPNVRFTLLLASVPSESMK